MSSSQSEEVAEEKREKRTIPEVLEEIGVGLAQVKVTLIAGAVWFADGAELLLISSVSDAVTDEWHLSSAQRGYVVSLVFIGVLIGNLISGPLGDNCGRRLPILISFACIFIFSFLSAISWGFWSLSMFRLCVGASFGIGQPTFQTLTSEVTPARGRILISGMGTALFAVGEAYSAFLLVIDDPMLKDLHWRWLLMMGAIPAAIFGLLAYLFLQNSPLYLACCGRFEESRVVLTSMRTANSAENVSVDFRVRGDELVDANDSSESETLVQTIKKQIGTVFGPDLRLTTLIVLTSCFTLNLTFYGCLYAFPQVIKEVKMSATPAANLLIGTVWELLGYVVGIAVALALKRISVMRLYFAMNVTAIATFTIGAHAGSEANWLLQVFVYYGYYGIKFFTSIGFLVVYLYAAEVFPTVVRNSGTAISIAGGRLASILSPIIYEAVSSATGSFVVFFTAIGILSALNFLLVGFLPYETAGMELQDSMETMETRPSKASSSDRPFGEAALRGPGYGATSA